MKNKLKFVVFQKIKQDKIVDLRINIEKLIYK